MAKMSTGDYHSRLRLLEEQLDHARRLEGIGLASGVVTHDLNNLLTPILGYATMLRRELDSDHPLACGVAAIEKAAERAADLINKLLASSRLVGQLAVPVNLGLLVEDILAKLAPDIPGTVVVQARRLAQDAMIAGDPLRLGRMIQNILCNSLDAMPDGGTLDIETEDVVLDDDFCKHHPGVRPGIHLCLSIADTGRGIPGEMKHKVFEPFFSTKPAVAGVGMGLPLACSIIRSHAGALELNSAEGAGTTVRVYLPAIISPE